MSSATSGDRRHPSSRTAVALDFAVGRGHCVLVGSRTSRSEWVASERGDVIYLDHNATTPIAPQVLDAMLPYLTQHYGNPSSEHAFGRRARLAVEEARAHVASLIGAEADEIVFTLEGRRPTISHSRIRGHRCSHPPPDRDHKR